MVCLCTKMIEYIEVYEGALVLRHPTISEWRNINGIMVNINPGSSVSDLVFQPFYSSVLITLSVKHVVCDNASCTSYTFEKTSLKKTFYIYILALTFNLFFKLRIFVFFLNELWPERLHSPTQPRLAVNLVDSQSRHVTLVKLYCSCRLMYSHSFSSDLRNSLWFAFLS